jgi:hypothetical protein
MEMTAVEKQQLRFRLAYLMDSFPEWLTGSGNITEEIQSIGKTLANDHEEGMPELQPIALEELTITMVTELMTDGYTLKQIEDALVKHAKLDKSMKAKEVREEFKFFRQMHGLYGKGRRAPKDM